MSAGLEECRLRASQRPPGTFYVYRIDRESFATGFATGGGRGCGLALIGWP